MHPTLLIKLAICLAISVFSLTTLAAPTTPSPTKSPEDLILDPDSFVHAAKDGIARSYAANGTLLDTARFDLSSPLFLFKRQDVEPKCQGEYCVNDLECLKMGCPGPSCYWQESWFAMTCHDLAFDEGTGGTGLTPPEGEGVRD